MTLSDEDQKWAQKHWLNVPGPVYTGETDNCWTGRLAAPRHVLYGGEHQNEFVYRQPRTPAEFECVEAAAAEDPWGGYAFDGDTRWTPEAVRAWWDQRGEVEKHITELIETWSAEEHRLSHEAVEGARDFLAYLAGDLEADLRAYIFRLEKGRCPGAGDQLPDL
ncbi:hypothetical protein ABZX92_40300 [Lentzea sp. NPDC006480]|uniref:hypothetical protein n=1 Tax=Lentzea sp. NPDC006480 TaxID=3157176 RepID=UPI0033BE4D79